MERVIHFYYNRHQKQWFHKKSCLSDVLGYEDNLMTCIDEISMMINYINDFSYTDIENLLNVLPIKLHQTGNVDYLYIDFRNSLVMINKYEIQAKIKQQNASTLLKNSLLNKNTNSSADEEFKSLTKLFIVKVQKDGTIKKETVIYNYLFSFIKVISGIQYTDDIGTVENYLKLADMNKI